MAIEDTSVTKGTCAVDPLVRILDVVFWITFAMLVGALVFLDEPAVNAVLMAVLVVFSGLIALYEFRLNPLPETERGEWTGRQLFYGLVFTISFFVAFIYILTVIF
jgi:hypothetical protein